MYVIQYVYPHIQQTTAEIKHEWTQINIKVEIKVNDSENDKFKEINLNYMSFIQRQRYV